MRSLVISILLISSFIHLGLAQDGLRLTSNEAMIGYTLFESEGNASLIDNCGKEVHRWSGISARYHSKLLPNGNLLYIENDSGRIIEKDWNNVEVVNIGENDNTLYLDYEVIVLPNGNYLCIGREIMDQNELEDLGFNFGVIGFPNRVDVIVELDKGNGNVVWKWNITDHVIQERDASVGNFGDLSQNPQLLNMDAIRTFDWSQEFIMINGFDYNPDLDQIVLSLRKMGEFAIIDHSTTTEEAAGSTGGAQGKGGDILYRWGNPENYERGEAFDRELYFQHNPNWVQHGQYEGHIIVYDNGLNRPNSGGSSYSAAKIVDTGVGATGAYAVPANDAFAPLDPTREYSRPATGTQFYSGYTSSAKVLPNQNILITVGGPERIIEINQAGEIIWEYGIHFPFNFVFRSEKYIREYSAFDGRDLTPGDAIEFPASSASQNCLSAVVETEWNVAVEIYLDSGNGLHVVPDGNISYELNLLNVSGQRMLNGSFDGQQVIDLSTLQAGFYFVHLRNEEGKIVVQKLVVN